MTISPGTIKKQTKGLLPMLGSIKRIFAKSQNAEIIIKNNKDLKGTIHSLELVKIDGSFEGDVVTSTDLIIGGSGIVRGNVNAENAVISGIVYGNVNILGKLRLSSPAKVYGNIGTNNLIIEEGAVFIGTCCMRCEPPAKTKNKTPKNKDSNSRKIDEPLAIDS